MGGETEFRSGTMTFDDTSVASVWSGSGKQRNKSSSESGATPRSWADGATEKVNASFADT